MQRTHYLADGFYSIPVCISQRAASDDDIPPVGIPVGDYIGYHNRKGGHGLTGYDWLQFLSFADKHLGISKNPK